MTLPCTAVILAGGLNTRFGGINKAFLEVGGRRILDRLMDLCAGRFEAVIIVTNDPVAYLEWDCTLTADFFPVRSSLTGIHAGLFCAPTEHAFVMACDTPFLTGAVVETILDRLTPETDVVVPQTAAGFEPLCAIYSRRCLQPMARGIAAGRFQIRRIFRKVRLRTVSEQRLREVDPDLISFFNINTPEDLARAEAVLETTAAAEEVS